MRGYAAVVAVPAEVQEVLRLIELVISLIPEDDTFEEVRCHEVARVAFAIADHRSLKIVDGHYGPPPGLALCPRFEHSWLTFERGAPGHSYIIDPYSIGRIPMVQLIDDQWRLGMMYVPGEDRADVKMDIVCKLVDHVRAQMGNRNRLVVGG